MSRAFLWVKFNGTFPATAVIPKISISSVAAMANAIATASSCPGSQSKIICFFILIIYSLLGVPDQIHYLPMDGTD
jgi:hypothetical protein